MYVEITDRMEICTHFSQYKHCTYLLWQKFSTQTLYTYKLGNNMHMQSYLSVIMRVVQHTVKML